MAFTFGFYNSLKGDRKYNAEQMSEIFDGILKDGIIPSQGQLFVVKSAENGMQITVGTGRAWFDHTWSKNDSVMVLNVPQSDITRPRYDAVVLEVNHDQMVRANEIKIVQGESAVNPVKPALVNTDKIKQYPLAYILVKAGTEQIKAEDIENMVGRSPTVFATGVLETVAIDDLWSQWGGEWRTWFEGIKLQLSGDIVTNLQYQIEQLKEQVLSDYTRNLYGVGTTGTPDDIFQLLYLTAFDGRAVMRVTVIDQKNRPVKNAIIDIVKNSGNLTRVVTNNTGSYVFSVSASESIDIKINSIMADISGSITAIAPSTGLKNVSLIVSPINFTLYTSTKNILISSLCDRIDVSLCGGGGGGTTAYYTECSGAGGGGGYTVNMNNVSFSPNSEYQIVVGSGGSGGRYPSYSIDAFRAYSGSAGGTSSVFGITANGGGGGTFTGSSNVKGTGNGNGADGVITGAGQNGYSTTQFVYISDSETAYAGGGGGSGGGKANSSAWSNIGGSGGSPNGGNGGNSSSNGSNSGIDGAIYGGGGGGGSIYKDGSATLPNGGSGGSGMVSIRFYHTSLF